MLGGRRGRHKDNSVASVGATHLQGFSQQVSSGGRERDRGKHRLSATSRETSVDEELGQEAARRTTCWKSSPGFFFRNALLMTAGQAQVPETPIRGNPACRSSGAGA